MKIILSRKGFDSSAGGVPSPITPRGRLISLPIPDSQSQTKYHQLIGHQPTVAHWVETLSNSKVRAHDGVHLDPDLDKKQLIRTRDWSAAFGQAGSALGHLDAQGIKEGDLFLYFGWFRQVKQTKSGWIYAPNTPDLHVLYGWLSVGSVWRHPEPVPKSISQHVHCNREFQGDNAVFLAARKFTCASGVLRPGFGLWSHFHPQLVLTGGATRSQWDLPAWFYPEGRESCLSYHHKHHRWSLNGDFCRLQAAARGQEFVLNCEHYPEAISWASRLIALADQ